MPSDGDLTMIVSRARSLAWARVGLGAHKILGYEITSAGYRIFRLAPLVRLNQRPPCTLARPHRDRAPKFVTVW